MKYYVIEGTPDGEYNAASKAREDVEKILINQGYTSFYIPSIYGVQKNKLMKWKQFFVYRKNNSISNKIFNFTLSFFRNADEGPTHLYGI